MISPCSSYLVVFVFFLGLLSTFSTIGCSAAQVEACPRSMLAAVIWRVSPCFYGLGPSEPELCWGSPLSCLCSSIVLATHSRRVSIKFSSCPTMLHTGEYPPPTGVDTNYHLRSETPQPDLPPIPTTPQVKLGLLPPPLHQEGVNFSPPPLRRSTGITPDRSTEPTILLLPVSFWSCFRCCSPAAVVPCLRSREKNILAIRLGQKVVMGLLNPNNLSSQFFNPIVSKPIFLWGKLISLINFLMIFGGFTEVITEADMHTTLYLSYRKSFPRIYLPMDSSGQFISPSSLSSFFPELRVIIPHVSFMREHVTDHFKKMKPIANNILNILINNLNSTIDESSEQTLMGTMRMNFNYYPQCPEPSLAVGAGRHSDINTLTLLLQEDGVFSSLYARATEDGDQWINVPPIPGAIVVNIGDVLQIMSNDRYRSVEHCVLANKSCSRVSIPVYCGPVNDSVIEPLPEVLEKNEMARYGKVVYSDYLKGFFEKPHDGKATIESIKF